MTARARVSLTGTVRVALPPDDAFALFTPSGEREWADGWNPTFPAPADDETRPGTVFVTEHGHPATWVVVACDPPRSVTYCTVSEIGRAGLVSVDCTPDPDGLTTATVTYDITALNPEGAAWLDDFASGYERYLAHWREAIAATLAQR